MSKFDLKDKLDKALYTIYNSLSGILFNLSFSKKRLLSKNLAYKDRHKDQHCFILGTGPSLKSLSSDQLNAIEKHVIFGTNSLYKAAVTAQLTPTYYCLMDNLYWEQWSHTFEEVVAKYNTCPPIFITDYRAASFAEQANSKLQHIYIHSKKYPISDMSENLHTNIYAAMNVVSYSILAALYMGFNRIYLLGCDYNAFCSVGRGHAYDDKSELKQVSYNLAFYLKFYWITTEFHYLIAKLAKRKGVEIVNLTHESLLDAYPRKSLDELLQSK